MKKTVSALATGMVLIAATAFAGMGMGSGSSGSGGMMGGSQEHMMNMERSTQMMSQGEMGTGRMMRQYTMRDMHQTMGRMSQMMQNMSNNMSDMTTEDRQNMSRMMGEMGNSMKDMASYMKSETLSNQEVNQKMNDRISTMRQNINAPADQ